MYALYVVFSHAVCYTESVVARLGKSRIEAVWALYGVEATPSAAYPRAVVMSENAFCGIALKFSVGRYDIDKKPEVGVFVVALVADLECDVVCLRCVVDMCAENGK